MDKFIKYYLPRKISQSGFTLIELLVAISIFTLLSSFMVLSYHNDEKAKVLKTQAQDIFTGLQRVQNMALTGEIVNSINPLSYRFKVSTCDIPDCNYKLTAIASTVPTEDIKISQTDLKTVGVVVEGNNLYVDFSPPRGKMKIYKDDPRVVTDAAVYEKAQFKIWNSFATYCIRLNSVSGRIDMVSADLSTDECPVL